MFIHYRTQGLILKKIDRGENDQLFVIYTKNFGKLEILGRAIRKIKSKLRSGAELFYLSEVEFIQGKTYKTLTDAILIDKFKGLRENLKKLVIAYSISEFFGKLIKNEEPDKKIWRLLNETFQKLNNCLSPAPNDPERIRAGLNVRYLLIYYYFFWNFLSILGYQPELYNCSFCQKKITLGEIYFGSKEGGVICPICFKKNLSRIEHYQEIDSDTVKTLRIILKQDWDILLRLKIKPSHLNRLKIISKDFLSVVSPF